MTLHFSKELNLLLGKFQCDITEELDLVQGRYLLTKNFISMEVPVQNNKGVGGVGGYKM